MAGGQHAAGEVDRQHPGPGRELDLDQGFVVVEQENAGGVDQKVEAAGRGEGACDRGGDEAIVADVALGVERCIELPGPRLDVDARDPARPRP